MTFDDLLLKLVKAGFIIELKLKGDTLWYEIQTGAKSNLVITKKDYILCLYEARYTNGECEDYQEFLYILKCCLCGRGYANNIFFEFLNSEGLVTKVIETTTTWRIIK